MLNQLRQEISRALTGCCVVLWLTGFLSVGHGNVTTHWTVSHCPQGQAQNGQQGHSHCVWHCAGCDVQNGSGRNETSADCEVGLVWSLGAAPFWFAVLDEQFPPRGPPQSTLGSAEQSFNPFSSYS